MSPLVKHAQILQHRLSFLKNVALPLTLLTITVGLSYSIYVAWPQIWLPVTTVLFFLAATGIWLGRRIFEQYVSYPIEELQAELKHPPQVAPPPPPIKEIDTFGTKETTPENTTNQLLEQHATEMIAELSLEGFYVYVSPACRELLGLTPTELESSSTYDLVHPKDLLPMQKVVASVIKTEEKSTTSYRMRHKDGHYVSVETVFKLNQQDNNKSLITVTHDITRHKQVEEEISQRNHELTILQSAGVAITSSLDLRYVLDTVTLEMSKLFSVDSCTISEWDREKNRVIRTARYSSDSWWDPRSEAEILRLPEHPLIKWVLEEQIPQQMTISQPNIDPAEFNYMQKTGIKTRLLLPMVFQRKVLGLVGLEDTRSERNFTYQEISLAKLVANQAASAIRNAQLFEQAQQEITERQRAEAALEEERAMLAQRVQERTADLSKANAELARAARLKDEFLAGMSHELRTPLNAILGSAEILHTEVFGALNERQSKFAHNIEESGTHLLSLINDILDLSKIEAGRLELNITPVSLTSVCEASVRLVKQLAHKKQLGLSVNLDENITTVQADERRLKQMLVNLLSNAIKFTPNEGKIGLDVVGNRQQQVVHLTVWDTGIGIAEEDMTRLFQPFVQLDSSLSRQYEGTGLGLSLVFKMAEMHGGGVSVDSKLNEGSKFTISLPWIETPADISSLQSSEVDDDHLALPIKLPGDKPPLVLLAEDKEENINLLTDYLESQGYIVIVARNGVEALERAKEETPDIILMDVQMPEMDGLEATRRIRADVDLVRIPVIALTALSMPGDKERCLAAGANEYMSKPVNLRALVRTINIQLINAGEIS